MRMKAMPKKAFPPVWRQDNLPFKKQNRTTVYVSIVEVLRSWAWFLRTFQSLKGKKEEKGNSAVSLPFFQLVIMHVYLGLTSWLGHYRAGSEICSSIPRVT